METVEFTTQLTKREYIRAFWMNIFTEKMFWLSMGWYFLVIGLIASFFMNNPFLLALLVVLAWIILYLSYVYYIYIRAMRRKNWSQGKIDWVMTPGTLLGKGEGVEIKIPTHELFHVKENWQFFLVWPTRKGFYLFPKKNTPVSVQVIFRSAMKKKMK